MPLSLAYPTNLLFVDEKYNSLSKCTTQLFDNVFVFIYILDISRLIIYYLIGNFHCLCTYLSQQTKINRGKNKKTCMHNLLSNCQTTRLKK